MTIIQLKYALAVAEYKNFTAAAKACFVTQPTLSMQIQKLEEELGVAIFDRSTHPISITKFGKTILDKAEKITRDIQDISNLVKEEKGLLTGTFSIGVIPTIAASLIPLFLPSFLKKYPEINLEIIELKTTNLLKELQNGSIDVGIAATPLGESKIIEKPLYNEPFVGFANKNHPIHQQEKLSSKNPYNHDILLLEEGHCFRNSILNICGSKTNHPRELQLKSGSLETLIKLVKQDFGMTYIPYLKAKELSQEDRLLLKEFEQPMPSREVSLIHHTSQLKLLFVQTLEQHIKAVMRGEILTDTKIISPKVKITIK